MYEAPKGWIQTTVGEILTIQYGKSLPAKMRETGQYKVYGSNGIIGSHNIGLTNAPTIIIGRKGSIGKIHFSESSCFPIDTTFYIDSFNGNNPKFISYLLESLPLSNMNRSTAIPGLNREEVYALKIYLPPISEQDEIVKIIDITLSRINQSIISLNHIPKLIDKYRTEIFNSIFNKIEETSSVFGSLIDYITSGSRGWAKYYHHEKASIFLRIGNTKRKNIDLDLEEIQYVKLPEDVEGKRTKVQPNDILITITADIGRVAYIPENFELEAYVNQHLALIRLKKPSLAKYISLYLISPKGQEQLHSYSRGMTRSGLRLDDLKNIKIPLPNIETQKDAVHLLTKSLDSIEKISNLQSISLVKLTELHQQVIKYALQGKMTKQSPNEPAIKLVNKVEQVIKPITKPISLNKKLSMKDIKLLILQDSKTWPKEGLNFLEIAKKYSVSYEDLKDCVFNLLVEEKDTFRQVFDKTTLCIHLQRIS